MLTMHLASRNIEIAFTITLCMVTAQNKIVYNKIAQILHKHHHLFRCFEQQKLPQSNFPVPAIIMHHVLPKVLLIIEYQDSDIVK